MDHAASMGSAHSLGDLGRDLQRRLDVEAAPGKARAKRLAGDGLHRDIRSAIGFADFVHFADERMVETRGRSRLGKQPPLRQAIGVIGLRQHLQRHVPV